MVSKAEDTSTVGRLRGLFVSTSTGRRTQSLKNREDRNRRYCWLVYQLIGGCNLVVNGS